jgi:hypothetical protein
MSTYGLELLCPVWYLLVSQYYHGNWCGWVQFHTTQSTSKKPAQAALTETVICKIELNEFTSLFRSYSEQISPLSILRLPRIAFSWPNNLWAFLWKSARTIRVLISRPIPPPCHVHPWCNGRDFTSRCRCCCYVGN